MSRKTITIDIDADAIRILEVVGANVTRWASAPLEPGLVKSGMILEPRALGYKVRDLMRSSGITGKSVIASVCSSYSIVRTLTVPRSTSKSVSDTVYKSVVATMPTDKLATTWQTLAMDKDGYHILAVGVPRDRINASIEVFRSVGIKPLALELKSLALVRAVHKEHAVIINTQTESFDIIVVTTGMPQLLHTIPCTTDISTSDRAELLIRSLDLAIEFYNSRHPTSRLTESTPLVLIGQLVDNPDFVERIQARISYHITAFSPPLTFPPHLPLQQYAVNLGLALRQALPPEEASTNMIPLNIDLQRAGKLPRKLRAGTIASYAALLLCLVLVFLLYSLNSSAYVVTRELQDRLGDIRSKVNLQQAQLKKLAALEAKIYEYDTIVADRGYYTFLLRVTEKVTPEDVKLSSISLTSTTVNITGTSDSLASAAYTQALRNTGNFSTVELPQMSTEGGAFTIVAKVIPPTQSK